jgi:hypothetical protein
VVIIHHLPAQRAKGHTMKTSYTVEELRNMEFSTEHEEGFRRGYLEGMLSALDYISDDGLDVNQLYRFWEQVLDTWAFGNCSQVVEPPSPNDYEETDEGFTKRT